jgi:hypothetical protein
VISIVDSATIAAVSNPQIYNALALVSLLVLLALLVQKELSKGLEGERVSLYSRILNVGIIPLMIAFAMIMAIGIGEILSRQ